MKTFSAPERKLALGSLVATMFFIVSGGPFGLEDLLRACGAPAACVILIATPLLWCVPTALLVGELAAALPEEGGYYAWVRRALGPFWGVQEAWLSLAAGVFDMGLYPALFVDYAATAVPAVGRHSALVGVAFIVACAAYNLRGASSVGNASRLQGVLVIAPFVVLSVVCVAHPASGVGTASTADRLDLMGGVLVAMWNFMGWDNATTFAREVANPQKTYPRAVVGAVVLVSVCYLLPVSAVAVAQVDTSSWAAGSWAELARRESGPALALATVLAGCLSALATFNSLVLSYSRLPAALAMDGFLPSAFSLRTKRTRAPYVAILSCAFAWMLSLGLPFMRLVMLDVVLYGLSLVLEFVALIALRVREPDLERPFRVPGGLPGVVLLAIPPTVLIGASAVRCCRETLREGGSPLVLGLLLIAVGPVLYAATRRKRRHARGMASRKASDPLLAAPRGFWATARAFDS